MLHKRLDFDGKSYRSSFEQFMNDNPNVNITYDPPAQAQVSKQLKRKISVLHPAP